MTQPSQEHKTGVLLVNLGTPNSPKPKDVFRYLTEFLTDSRVIDIPWLQRQLLVRGIIIPKRLRQSAKSYEAIWTPQGSPLKVFSQSITEKLQASLGNNFHVELAMRYQTPSIEDSLQRLMEKQPSQIIIVPLFPQYASATTGSVHQKVMEVVSQWINIPKMIFINHFADHPSLIQAFCTLAKECGFVDYDHVLFSFHGLPERQLLKADKSKNHCRKCVDCCKQKSQVNAQCYSALCHQTAQAVATALKLDHGSHSISFQSRLGKEPWIEPYTSDVIRSLAKSGRRRVLVFCPSFVCDCLETIYEIGVEYAEEFKHAGGEKLQLVPGLNDHPAWISALKDIVIETQLAP